MNGFKSAFIVGTLGLAAITGTLATLIGAIVLGCGAYVLLHHTSTEQLRLSQTTTEGNVKILLEAIDICLKDPGQISRYAPLFEAAFNIRQISLAELELKKRTLVSFLTEYQRDVRQRSAAGELGARLAGIGIFIAPLMAIPVFIALYRQHSLRSTTK